MISPQPQTDATVPPRHIAIIMDGNGRWAKARFLPRLAGHRRGAEAVRRCVEACIEIGVSYLTLYAFSKENWKRPADEVDDLMGLLRLYLQQELRELHKNGVKVRFIGDQTPLAADIVALIRESEALTAGNHRLNLVIALNYGSQAEIASAARRLAEDVAAGHLQSCDVDERTFARYLLTHDIPDPDLVIRTSGEKRLSNFLLWQSAYAELVFIDGYWPDFDAATLRAAIEEYHQRERRFGAR